MTNTNHDKFVHCPRCASREIFWQSPKNFSCKECGFVLFINLAAAVAVIIECRGSLLFGLRKHDPARGMLDLPGGFVDPGETGEEAALREVREETGIELPRLQYLFSIPNYYPYKEIVYETLDLIFFCSFSEPPRMQAADDLEELLWVDCDRIDYERIAFTSLRKGVKQYLDGKNRPLSAG